jgi:hypothetical protein
MRFFASLLLLGCALPALARKQVCSPNNGNGALVPGTNNCYAECSIDRPGGRYRKFKATCFEDCVSPSIRDDVYQSTTRLLFRTFRRLPAARMLAARPRSIAATMAIATSRTASRAPRRTNMSTVQSAGLVSQDSSSPARSVFKNVVLIVQEATLPRSE